MPSFHTVRMVVQQLGFKKFSEAFFKWPQQRTDLSPNEWVHVDGKAIKGTMGDYSQENQHFINLVSLYCCKSQLVIRNAQVNNSKESEIPVVKQLIANLGFNEVSFTLDTLHCQKNDKRNHQCR